jgi:cellulase/cellobiase CelA1
MPEAFAEAVSATTLAAVTMIRLSKVIPPVSKGLTLKLISLAEGALAQNQRVAERGVRYALVAYGHPLS